MSGLLVYSERNDLALELLTGGRDLAAALGKPLSLAMAYSGARGGVEQFAAHGAGKIYIAEDVALESQLTDVVAEALAQIARQAEADVVLIGSSRRGRVLAPRLAQKLGAGCVTDAGSLVVQDGRLVSMRLALGGNTLKEEAITGPVAVISVTPGTFEASPGGAGAGETIEVTLDLTPSRAQSVERRAKEVGAVNIEQAGCVVCMGRGVSSKDDIPMVEALAKALSGEVAGTRPLAYEYEWIPEDRMVGISGKTVKPGLYVTVGVSGQIQHTVAVRDSKIIVAIDKDKSAPIFEMADYGIVGDLYEVVPRLTEALGGG